MATVPTVPATSYVPGNIPSAADFNTYIRDAQSFFLNPPRAVAKDSSGSVTRAARTTWTAVNWNAEDADTDLIHNTGVNTSRLTAVTAGYYYAWVSIVWEVHSVTQYDGLRGVVIRKNSAGSPVTGDQVALDRRASNSNPNSAFTASQQSCGGYVSLAVTDYVEVLVYDNDDDTVPIATPSGCFLDTTRYISMRFGMQWVSI